MDSGYILKCHGCGRANPAGNDPVNQRARCAVCNAPLVVSNCLAQDVDDASWAEEVEGSAEPVIAYFWGEECPVCEVYDLTVRKMAADFCGFARVVRVKMEDSPETASRLGIRGVPQVALYVGGSQVALLEGPRGPAGLRERLEKALGG